MIIEILVVSNVSVNVRHYGDDPEVRTSLVELLCMENDFIVEDTNVKKNSCIMASFNGVMIHSNVIGIVSAKVMPIA